MAYFLPSFEQRNLNNSPKPSAPRRLCATVNLETKRRDEIAAITERAPVSERLIRTVLGKEIAHNKYLPAMKALRLKGKRHADDLRAIMLFALEMTSKDACQLRRST